jgi:hypothetical protein
MTKIAIVPNAAGTGTFSIEAPNSNSNRTLTLPDAAGELDTLQRAGNVLQVVQGTQATDVILSNNNTYTNTGLSVSITPFSLNNKIMVLISQRRGIIGNANYFSYSGFTRLLRGSTSLEEKRITLGAGNSTGGNNALFCDQVFTFLDAPNTVTSVTYSTQIKGGFTTVAATDQALTGSIITLLEIAG